MRECADDEWRLFRDWKARIIEMRLGCSWRVAGNKEIYAAVLKDRGCSMLIFAGVLSHCSS
jgi:hypothetical protein